MIRTRHARLAATFLIAVLGGCGGPPQIGADRETFRAVDALYTAVGLRDGPLVDRCRSKLDGLRDAGKIPGSAARSLDSIIADAKEGRWETAQDRLARFMEGQRR
jgi:hypothetical protein